MQTTSSSVPSANLTTKEPSLVVDLTVIENPTLARLMAEVKNVEGATMGAYDRAHNRHNR